MKPNEIIITAVDADPAVLQYLDWHVKARYYKAAPITRDEIERRLARLIYSVDKVYLAMLRQSGTMVPFGFWQDYEADLRKQISGPLRQYIEQSFTNYSDYVNFIDRSGAVDDINTAMTRAISEMAGKISETTQRQLSDLIMSGISQDEIIDAIALRFSSGHAEQVAITELTRAEAYFSDALSARLGEQNVNTQIRWLTSEDERVCPLCGPLDHKLKKDGGWIIKGNLVERPPAHPNCRCKTVVEVVK